MAKPRCYVASPLGFTESGRHYNSTVLLPALAEVVEPVCPWELGAGVVGRALADRGVIDRQAYLEIGVMNLDAIDSCQLLAAVLEGQEADSGTVGEVGWAARGGLTCFGLRSDMRQAGEPDMALNLQVEALVLRSGGHVVSRLADLVAALDVAARGLLAV
jgi:nucleoside 2-deoxyribosyltransferase